MIIYHVLVDRFTGSGRNKVGFLGGRIKGITKKLDYIKNLGANCIWLSPIYRTNMYHGYHITDFRKIEPRFGSEKDLRELVREAHKRKMKVLLDFVPNHCSNKHPFFLDAKKNKESKYRDWFIFDKNGYRCFLDVKELPKINLENKEARHYMIETAKYWAKYVDGFRLDHAIGPSYGFWREFRKEMRPGFLLIGEVWFDGIKKKHANTLGISAKLKKKLGKHIEDEAMREYVGIFDGCLDFTFNRKIRELFTDKMTPEIFVKEMKRHYGKFPKKFLLPTFLDNHDMDRFLYLVKNDKRKLKMAAAMQFTINQPAIIYYGTETGLSDRDKMSNFSEKQVIKSREPMSWSKQDQYLLDFYKKITRFGQY
jgi:cyclomaltodextrinase